MQLDLGVLFIKLKIWSMGTSKISVYFALLDETNWAFICFGDFHIFMEINAVRCLCSPDFILTDWQVKKYCLKVQFHMLIHLTVYFEAPTCQTPV